MAANNGYSGRTVNAEKMHIWYLVKFAESVSDSWGANRLPRFRQLWRNLPPVGVASWSSSLQQQHHDLLHQVMGTDTDRGYGQRIWIFAFKYFIHRDTSSPTGAAATKRKKKNINNMYLTYVLRFWYIYKDQTTSGWQRTQPAQLHQSTSWRVESRENGNVQINFFITRYLN